LIKSIQYLRAIAALMVVWHHSLSQVKGVRELIPIPEFGPSGVDLFFVISGFIMLVTTTKNPLSPRKFLELRVVRVVPLYWLMTLLMVGCAALIPYEFKTLQLSVPAVVKSLLFIPYNSLSFPGHPWPLLVPGWSLNYEMFFYLLFALALLIPLQWRVASLLATLVCLVVAGIIIGPAPAENPLLWVYTSPALLEFAGGVVVGHLWLRQALRVPLGVSIAAIAVGCFLLFMRDGLPFMSFTLPLGAFLTVAGCLHPKIGALNSPLLLKLGDASYSIYLTHIFTLGLLRVVWTHFDPSPPSLASAAAFMAVALLAGAAAGFAVYKAIEKPLTDRLRLTIDTKTFRGVASVSAG
jgi:exopolysaccharide production protein ExoZ